jgi:hypothetical protein
MSLDLVVPELADRVWEEGDESAALALQAVARTDTETSDTAWNALVETLMEGEEGSACLAGEGLAYYCVGDEEQVDRVFEVLKDALVSQDRFTRQAALTCLNQASEVSPKAAEKKPELTLWLMQYDFNDVELPK